MTPDKAENSLADLEQRWEELKDAMPPELTDCLHERLRTVSLLERHSYYNGDQNALWRTLQMYSLVGEPLPFWARQAIVSVGWQKKCWDDVFGEFRRNKHQAQTDAVMKVSNRMRLEGRKVNATDFFDDLASEVGKAYETIGISAGTAKRRYYELKGQRELEDRVKKLALDLGLQDYRNPFLLMAIILGDNIERLISAVSGSQENAED
jgi:hypothetical protein